MVVFFTKNSSVFVIFSFLNTLPASFNPPQEVNSSKKINVKFIFFILIFNKKASNNISHNTNSNKYICTLKVNQ